MSDKEAINIMIVSLNYDFSKKICENLAQKMDMQYADCYDLIVYDLIRPNEVLDKCGIEYFKRRERDVLKRCVDYYNTVLTMNYELFKDNYTIFNKSLIIYLLLPEDKVDKVTNKIVYENRNTFLCAHSDKVIKLQEFEIEKSVKKIIEILGEMYEDC